MKIIVTGGCGFIGSHLVDRLVELGHTVAVIDNLSTGREIFRNPKAVFHRADIRDERIGRIFEQERPQVLFHLAAQINVRKSTENPAADNEINVGGTISLIRAFLSCESDGEKKIVFSSTGGAIYGEQQSLPVSETVEPYPLCPYGISKLAVEKYLYYYWKMHGLKYLVLRYANVYGPRQNALAEAGVVAIFARAMLRGEQPVIFGDGEQTRDFVYVEDVVRANIMAMEHGEAGLSLNVGTGREVSVNEVFARIAAAAGSKAERRHLPPKEGEVRRNALDNELIGKVFDWKPTVRFDEGISRTVAWFRENRLKEETG